MRFSENRLIGWIVLAVCVLLSISLSGGKAMMNMRDEAQQIFYEGVRRDGVGINRDLDTRATTTYKLASVASKYLDDGDAALTEARAASTALEDAREIATRYQANVRLTRAVEDLYTRIEQQNLSEADRISALSAYKDIKSCADTISRNEYNNEARSFNGSIAQFPANIISEFTGVEPLQLFE